MFLRRLFIVCLFILCMVMLVKLFLMLSCIGFFVILKYSRGSYCRFGWLVLICLVWRLLLVCIDSFLIFFLDRLWCFVVIWMVSWKFVRWFCIFIVERGLGCLMIIGCCVVIFCVMLMCWMIFMQCFLFMFGSVMVILLVRVRCGYVNGRICRIVIRFLVFLLVFLMNCFLVIV